MFQPLKIILLLSIIIPSMGTAGEIYTELNCLAANVFMEARGESLKGMQAVADVVINRVKDPSFPASICGVIKQPYQFSWVKGDNRAGKLLRGDTTGLNTTSLIAYHKSQLIASKALSEGYKPLLPSNVVSFHNNTVTPNWSTKMNKYTRIGSHTFYSFKRKGSK